MNTLILTFAISGIALSIGFAVAGIASYLQPAAATGCEIQEVEPFFTDAISSIERGDPPETTLSILKDGQNELKDMFAIEEEENGKD